MEIRTTEVHALINKLELYKTKQQILVDEEKTAHEKREEQGRLESRLRHKEFRKIAVQKVRNSCSSCIHRMVYGQHTFSALRRQVKEKDVQVRKNYSQGMFKSKIPYSVNTYYFHTYEAEKIMWTIDQYINKLKLASDSGGGSVVVLSNDDVKFLVDCRKKFD